MDDDKSKLYKNKVDHLKTKVQNEYYYHAGNSDIKAKRVDRLVLIDKLNNIFKSPSHIYKSVVNIMYKNGEITPENVIGLKEDYLITLEGNKIPLSEISDIK